MCLRLLEEIKIEKIKYMKLTALEDTSKMMSSKDYKERFIAEYLQIKIRYKKLKELNIKYEAGNYTSINYLNFVPSCTLELLKKQQNIMGQYLNCLEIRALIEQIELPKYE